MSMQHSDSFDLIDVPNVDFSVVGAQRKRRPLDRPANRGHSIRQSKITQFCHLRIISIPQIHIRGQSNSQKVLLRPIYEIQVEIILKCWCIEYLIRQFVDFPLALDGSHQFFGEVQPLHVIIEGLALVLLLTVLEQIVVLEVFYGVIEFYGLFGFIHDAIFVDVREGQRARVDRCRCRVLIIDLIFVLFDDQLCLQVLSCWDEAVSHYRLFPRKVTVQCLQVGIKAIDAYFPLTGERALAVDRLG